MGTRRTAYRQTTAQFLPPVLFLYEQMRELLATRNQVDQLCLSWMSRDLVSIRWRSPSERRRRSCRSLRAGHRRVRMPDLFGIHLCHRWHPWRTAHSLQNRSSGSRGPTALRAVIVALQPPNDNRGRCIITDVPAHRSIVRYSGLSQSR